MSGESETPGVNYERVEVPPANGDDDTLDTGDTAPASPPANDGTATEDIDPENDPDDESPTGKPEQMRQPSTPVIPTTTPAPAIDPSNPHGLKRLPDETPREWALRLELADTRTKLRLSRTGEVMETIRPQAPQAAAPILDERTKAILEKYPKEQLDALREVFPALASEMGFVRKEELAGDSYTGKAQDELDSFMERHPEYTPEKDPDGSLWGAFKAEFGQYKQPTNPKDYRRLFEKVHQSVFGIQPGGALPKVQAAQRKVQVASHAGASAPPAPARPQKPGAGSGLRLDMLKGFDDDTKEKIAARAQGD